MKANVIVTVRSEDWKIGVKITEIWKQQQNKTKTKTESN